MSDQTDNSQPAEYIDADPVREQTGAIAAKIPGAAAESLDWVDEDEGEDDLEIVTRTAETLVARVRARVERAPKLYAGIAIAAVVGILATYAHHRRARSQPLLARFRSALA